MIFGFKLIIVPSGNSNFSDQKSLSKKILFYENEINFFEKKLGLFKKKKFQLTKLGSQKFRLVF